MLQITGLLFLTMIRTDIVLLPPKINESKCYLYAKHHKINRYNKNTTTTSINNEINYIIL